MNTTLNLHNHTLIPDLLLSAPQVRPVLDRYGLQGCGGPLGPMETLAFFAKAHDVPLDQLLEELRSALKEEAKETSTNMNVNTDHQPKLYQISTSEPEYKPRLEDTIYRPFFKAGMAVILTLGAVWGAYLLLRIGFSGSFTSVGLHEVNAHGHAQIFGWVGLFVMGFAYQAFPRFKHTSLAWPKAAYATLIMMVAGILVRSVTEPMVASYPALTSIALGASILEVIAIVMFAGIIVATLRKSGKPLAFYDYYILSALFWFIVQGVYETLLFNAYIHAPDREALLHLVATWQAPLREIQIHGFAMLMIFGVSQRLFHNFYDLPAPSPRRSLISLGLLNLAIVGIIVGFVLMRTVSHAWASLWFSSILLMVGTITVLVWNWGIFSRTTETDRNLKFLRAAYIWLFISLSMLVLLPVYQFIVIPAFAPESAAAQMKFSHAYYGAIRHAVTVGFISLMIVGVAAKVVPTLNGLSAKVLSGLWAPFILINLGCAIRVVGQTLTDFSPAMFPFAGVSGILEVTGLALWSAHLLAIMAGRVRVSKPALSSTPASIMENEVISAKHVVGDVLERYPALIDTFIEFGFHPLKNKALRNTIARTITIDSAAHIVGVDIQILLQSLNEEKRKLALQQKTRSYANA